jgi:serine protease
MCRFAIILVACAFTLLPGDGNARLTRNCNTNFGVGEIILTAPFDARREILAIVADPARNRDAFERLWQPKAGRETTYHAFENEVILGYDRIQDTEEMASAIRADPVLAALGIRHASANTAQACFSALPPAVSVTVTEYHNRLLNHYFMSSSAAENAFIDSGGAGEGWERTGETLAAIEQDYCHASRPVFRFYARGVNSHFFTVDAAECGGLRINDPGWQYEGEAFGAMLPSNGTCPGRTRPVYRLYNNRAALHDSNHRFVTRLDLYAQMQARGWIGEGVAMCVARDASDWWQSP